MASQMVATCDECNKIIIYDGTQTSTYVMIVNQNYIDTSTGKEVNLPGLVPPNATFCGWECIQNYTPKPGV